MATMIIDSWSTTCSECKKGTDWDEEGHLTIRGYSKNNGEPGCGAEWDAISFTYYDFNGTDWLTEMKTAQFPDLAGDGELKPRYPQWMIDLYEKTLDSQLNV